MAGAFQERVGGAAHRRELAVLAVDRRHGWEPRMRPGGQEADVEDAAAAPESSEMPVRSVRAIVAPPTVTVGVLPEKETAVTVPLCAVPFPSVQSTVLPSTF